MYDTSFFRNTYDLKQQIVGGAFDASDRDHIFAGLSSHLADEPFVFNIETTSVCNMKCVMCQRTTDMRRTPRHMDEATYRTIVSQIRPQDEQEMTHWQAFVDRHLRDVGDGRTENDFYYDIVSRSITLHNFGEPLLDPRLPERVRMLTDKGVPSYFSCNPCNIELGLVGRLFQAGLGVVKFAMDSLDDEQARQVRGPRADFTRSYANVLAVLDLKERMQADTTIVLTMLDFFGDPAVTGRFLDLWRDRDVYAYAKSVDNQWLLARKSQDDKVGTENRSHYKKQYCEYAWTSVTILEDGSVVPCTQDINGAWTFGNVNDRSLTDIWKSEKYREFRALQLDPDPPDDFVCVAKCDLNLVSNHYRKRQWTPCMRSALTARSSC
jgi:radical SAM protein with 4Fe4S-binding SPASM domain